MPKPVCVPCERFMRPKQNGIRWVEGMPVGEDAKPGKLTPEKWKLYKVWVSDLWECPDCLAQIIVGHGAWPISEHYKEGFSTALAGTSIFVKDC